MKTAQVTIETLRERLKSARQEQAGRELKAFIDLLEHPDAQWSDVLAALPRWMLAEPAALQFYIHFHVPRKGTEVERDPKVWKEYLKSHGLKLSDKVASSIVKN